LLSWGLVFPEKLPSPPPARPRQPSPPSTPHLTAATHPRPLPDDSQTPTLPHPPHPPPPAPKNRPTHRPPHATGKSEAKPLKRKSNSHQKKNKRRGEKFLKSGRGQEGRKRKGQGRSIEPKHKTTRGKKWGLFITKGGQSMEGGN